MREKGQLRRFENKAQLLRHIAAETGTDLDILWDEYETKVEQTSS
jgi:RNAse (barnase) inhibitor barstar